MIILLIKVCSSFPRKLYVIPQSPMKVVKRSFKNIKKLCWDPTRFCPRTKSIPFNTWICLFDAWKKDIIFPKWRFFHGDESHGIESAKNHQQKNTSQLSCVLVDQWIQYTFPRDFGNSTNRYQKWWFGKYISLQIWLFWASIYVKFQDQWFYKILW